MKKAKVETLDNDRIRVTSITGESIDGSIETVFAVLRRNCFQEDNSEQQKTIPSTLKGKPVRILEIDGKFHIQIKISYQPFRFFWQKEKPNVEEWRYPFDNGTLDWSEGNYMMHSFSSLQEAITKINSLNKGTIIHNL